MSAVSLNYKLEETTLSKYTPFDEVVPIYQQVCRNINTTYICQPHFALTLLYLVLPAEDRDAAINEIYGSIITTGNLYEKTFDELLENVEINELLQKDYDIDPADLLRFNDKQIKILYAMFYESLFEISLDNYYNLQQYF